MKNKTNRIYAIILIVATILFIAGMVKCIFSLKFTYNPGTVTRMVSGSSNSMSVKERLDYLDTYVLSHGPDVIYDELYYGHSYEPEFDKYWEFADIQIAAFRGRFADDNSEYKAQIEEFIANSNDEAQIEAAKGYLSLMDSDGKKKLN